MALRLLTAATVFPVSLTEAKSQCHVTHADEDALLNGYIEAATRYVEQSISQSVASQTWELTLDAFADNIELARGPVISVDTFNYVDADGATQPVSASLYTLDKYSRPSWIVRNSDSSWPVPLAAINVVTITYTTGMAIVPKDIKQAIQLLIGHWHANREAANADSVKEVPLAVDALLMHYRWVLV